MSEEKEIEQEVEEEEIKEKVEEEEIKEKVEEEEIKEKVEEEEIKEENILVSDNNKPLPKITLQKIVIGTVSTDFKGWFMRSAIFMKQFTHINDIINKKLESDSNFINTVCPEIQQIFRAFTFMDKNDVKFIIVGLDPYYTRQHDHMLADGLAFSVNEKLKGKVMPPSLRRIKKRVVTDMRDNAKQTVIMNDKATSLAPWAKQGGLLLNLYLTTELGASKMHSNWGWDNFIYTVVRILHDKIDDLVIMLWSRDSRDKLAGSINEDKALLLEANHPSRKQKNSQYDFDVQQHFSRCYKYLLSRKGIKIDWSLK